MACAVLLSTVAAAGHTAGANPRHPGTRSSREAARPVTEPAQMGEWLRGLAGRYRFEGSVEVRMRATVPEPPPGEQGEPASLADQILQRIRMESGQTDVTEATPVRGMGDCVSIGTGPGVQCVFQVTWDELREEVVSSRTERGGIYNLPGGVSNLAPAMAEFGIDPGGGAVRFLLVDSAGLAEGSSGSLAGRTATFRTKCANGPTILAGLRPPPIRQPDSPPPPQPPRTCSKTMRIETRPDARVLYFSVDIELDGQRKTTYALAMRRMQQSPAPVR
jgi:hypothetical protein